ncbi:cleft lip and palate associated transmembrane protein [Thelephora terrestris]|uniref:Cleft lip and palate associated transmembrane protein n=1 Tax=Thelephora terrestris TaxID=56493 RepID=A0A9P6L2W1_9AGAM|nr:cleft lip and palate associated transmembrane protein [Thelephora terrestris]
MPEAQASTNAQQGDQGGGGRFWGMLQQALLIYVAMQFAGKLLGGFNPPQEPSADHAQAVEKPQVGSDGQILPPQPQAIQNAVLAWPFGSKLSMHVYLSTDPEGDVFGHKEPLPQFVWDDITFGDWNEARVIDLDVNFSEGVQHNGSMWADIFLVRDNATPNPHSADYNPLLVNHIRRSLTYYLPKGKIRKVKNLLGGKQEVREQGSEPEPADEIVSHWHHNLTLALVSDTDKLNIAKIPPPVAQHVHMIPGALDSTQTVAFFYPIVFPNEFWQLRSQFVEINSTVTHQPLQITLHPMSFMKFQLYAAMAMGFKDAAKQQGSGAELDEMKRMLTETNPYLLALTGIVSILHMVFEILAFKNDVSHWKQKKEMVGVSLRSIVLNVFVQIVVLLYLIDNNEQTSYMILLTSGMGVLVEAWKITKAVDIVLLPAPESIFKRRIEILDKHVLSEDEKKTQEYDALAFRYVSYGAIPCLAGYTIYSLIYESHRGWYSFVITTLTSFVYMFGFAQLIPQLIINYKLKSVAHMPMKAMIYKTLSTVVDDFFAFCIKMPILHRLACFRDDVVFLIFLYQRWIYRIDPKRANEYGQVMATDVDAAKARENNKEKKKTE